MAECLNGMGAMVPLRLLAGCGDAGRAEDGFDNVTASRQGDGAYERLCLRCHGGSARGDGPDAVRLSKLPADLSGRVARNGGVFSEIEAMAQIYGYQGRYHLGLMPEFGPVIGANGALPGRCRRNHRHTAGSC